MLVLHTSDLMGRAGHYAALASVATAARPHVLVLGGNNFPDDSSRHPEEMGTRQPAFVLDAFRRWLGDLTRALPGLQVATVFGNHDWLSSAAAIDELARQMPQLHVLTHERAIELAGLPFVGYSRTPPTSGYTKDFERLDLPGDLLPLVGGARWDPVRKRAQTGPAKHQYTQFPSIGEELERLAAPATPWVFVCHCPPHDTVLDSNFQREPIGSRGVRQAIEKRQPLLSLHGHVSSSPDITGACQTTLGKTVAINVGQHHEALCCALIEIDIGARRIVRVDARRPR
ncbi:MAG: metallophosphoesterase [Phycisphaerae bacterium]